MGGGFPAAAFGGRADVMAQLAPAGPVYQAGTLSGNPVATAAGLAHAAAAARRGLRAASTRSPPTVARPGAPRRWPRRACAHRVQTAGNMFSVFFTDAEVRDYDGREAAGGVPLHRLLPRDAGAGRVPAAVRVRGLVRLGRARRRGRSSGSPPRCPRRPRAPPRTAHATMSGPAAATDRADEIDRRPPDAARRGAQPRRRALRPAARLPPVRARPARWPTGSPSTSPGRDITHVVASPLERAQETAAPIADGARA